MNSSERRGHISGLFYSEPCLFEEILPIWSRELWPGRVSPIESNSAMKWRGGIDMSLMNAPATFWRLVRTGTKPTPETILGVLSGHFGGEIESPAERSYRTRGLWVSPEVRRAGGASMLMTAAYDQALKEGCPTVWTFPRESSMPFYESMGFKRVGPWIGENDPGAGEFGPNCYALYRTPISMSR